MENLKFSTLYVYKLSNENIRGLLGRTCDESESAISVIGDLPNSALVVLRANLNLFSAQVNREQKSVLTEKVNEYRTECNTVFSEIKRVVKFETKSRDGNKKEFALILETFLKPYNNLSKQTLLDQQESTKEMLEKYYADAILTKAANIIGLDTIFDELKTANTNLEKIYNARNNEIGTRTESSSQLRPSVIDSYQKFCTLIELAVEFLPNVDLINLLKNMEELRIKYRALIPQEEIIPEEEIKEVYTED